MALINIDLGDGETVINADNADTGDTINLNILGSGTLVVDGVDVTLTNIIGVGELSSPTFAAQNGGHLTVDQGLLKAGILSNQSFDIRDSGTITLDASSISLGLTETLLNSFNVEYSGDYHTGTFIYDPPLVSIAALAPANFTVTGMAETDVFEISGRDNLRLDAPLSGFPPSRDPEDAYQNGVLHLISPGIPLLGESVSVEIPMTREQFDQFLSDQNTYLSGGTFTFPGQLAVPCFTRGTLISTPTGDVAVEDLREGDLVLTKDNGPQPIRWIGSKSVENLLFPHNEKIRPIRIKAGALGVNTPAIDLIVSPQHRILVRSNIVQKMFSANEVLVAAKQLLQIDGIDTASDMTDVEYFHILFDTHEVVFSNGAETESLYTGPQAINSLPKESVEEIFRIFPELRDIDYTPSAARILASGRQSRKMAVRHVQNGKPLIAA
jgi:hypothetical protein